MDDHGFIGFAETSGGSGTGRIHKKAFYKFASDSEPAKYTVNVSPSPFDGERWSHVVAGRVTFSDPTNPIGITSTKTSSTVVQELTLDSFTTSHKNALLIASVAVLEDDVTQFTAPDGMDIIYSWLKASTTSTWDPTASGAAEVIAAPGATGNKKYE